MTTTTGFQVWAEGKKVAIRMPKLQQKEGHCPKCFRVMEIEPDGKTPWHTAADSVIQRCPGVGRTALPVVARKPRPTRLGTGKEEYEYSDRSDAK